MVADTYDDAIWGSIKFAVAVIQSSICLGCLCFSIHIRFRIAQRDVSRVTSCCTILGLFFFLISSISLATCQWSRYITHQWSRVTAELWFSLFVWSLGQFCSYLVFLFRLVNTFKTSVFLLRRSSSLFLVVLLIIYELLWIMKCISSYLFWPYKGYNLWTREFITISILIVDATITVSMTNMFVKRLFAVMRGQAMPSNDRHLQMEELNRSLNINGSNYKLMNLSVKIAVLSITSLLSSFILVSLNVSVFFIASKSIDSELYWSISDILTTTLDLWFSGIEHEHPRNLRKVKSI